jgi:hypothetical protein
MNVELDYGRLILSYVCLGTYSPNQKINTETKDVELDVGSVRILCLHNESVFL